MTFEHENDARAHGFEVVCGIDEAGRGPLAGPVCAAAVILPDGYIPDGLNDSKKLSEKKRDALYDIIIENCVSFSIAMASEKEIDEYNILQATFLAMRRAVVGLSVAPDAALIDGNQKPGLAIAQKTIIKGDACCPSIAAASILAKVTRDRFMQQLDAEYPEYQFAKHKGYPTKLHYEMIREHGVSPVHRLSFLKKMH